MIPAARVDVADLIGSLALRYVALHLAGQGDSPQAKAAGGLVDLLAAEAVSA